MTDQLAKFTTFDLIPYRAAGRTGLIEPAAGRMMRRANKPPGFSAPYGQHEIITPSGDEEI
ncbi:MAG: hypothetical protein ACT4O2_07820 [Beijerinckiaceae bacterium]